MLLKRGKPGGLSRRRVRTPLVIQMEAVECGAASLGMVLGHFGRHVSLDVLRVQCGVSRDGSNAANVLKVARQYGCQTRGMRTTADEVLKGPFPVILFWNFSHFLVLEGASKDRAYLNDPAVGRRAVPFSEFEKSFSGVALAIEPGDGFERGGKRSKPIAEILHQAADYRVQLAFVILIGILIVLPSFTIPNFAGVFVENILLDGQKRWLRPLILALLLAISFQLLLSWLKFATLWRIGTHMTANKTTKFLWHVLRLPSQFFALRYQGDIASRISSVDTVSQLISSQIGVAIFNLFSAAILFVLMIMLEPVLAVVAIVGALTNLVVLRLFHRARFESSVRLSVDQGKLFAASHIGLKAIETLKSTGGEDDFFGKWAGYHARALMSEQSVARLDQLSALMPAFVVTMTTALALWVGGERVIDSALTLGALIAFQALFAAVSEPVQQMVNTVGQTQQAAANLTRIDDVLKHQVDWRHTSDGERQPLPQGGPAALRLENVSFGYNRQAPAMVENFNLTIDRGGWTALVGASGCGKSTLGKLASGLFQPWDGSIQINGVDIRSIDRQSLADTVGFVDQDIVLFEGTFRENLTLWDPSVTEDDLVAAAETAQIVDLLSANAEGIDARVEENGRNLSGGERQRVEIARAIVRSPSLLIMDEATSALDPITELRIMEALKRRMISCLLVAHRLSTIRDCDEIIVLDKGRVVERGSHDELMALDGAYHRLIRAGETG